MASSSLHHHMDIMHSIVLPQNRGLDVRGGGVEKYMVSFPRVMKSVGYLVDGCPARSNIPGRIREHFIYPHWKSKVETIQEGPKPLTRCNHCGMHILEVWLMKIDGRLDVRRQHICAKSFALDRKSKGFSVY